MSISTVTPAELKEWMKHRSCLILDVRSLSEFASDHIPGAVHLPITNMEQDVKWTVPGHNTVVVTVCAHGYRSAQAAQLLQSAGVGPVYSLAGGMEAWHQRAAEGAHSCSARSAGFDRPRSILYGAIHLAAAVLALYVEPQWAWINVWLGAGMILNGLIGWCGLSVFFRNRR
jgi:rhodanese-related sulfurtransferase